MSPDVAAVFAQVIPVLMIATFLGNIGFSRVPGILRLGPLYVFALGAAAEIVLLYRLAYGVEFDAWASSFAFLAVCLQMLILCVAVGYRILVEKHPDTDRDTDRENS